MILGKKTKSKLEACEEVNARFACTHDNVGLRERAIAGGKTQFCHQCLRCGDRVGQAIAKTGQNPPPFDEVLREVWVSSYKRAYADIDKQYDRAFWDDYTEYLKSPAWEKRRRLVMLRAAGICEGCRERPATLVHHLTYEHAGNELLFELVALCHDCHEVCHPGKGV